MAIGGFKTVMAMFGALALGPLAVGQKVDDVVDSAAAFLRDQQNEDGSYGALPHVSTTTATALLAFGECHRKYDSSDGPFIRKAISRLIEMAESHEAVHYGHDVARVKEALRWAKVPDDSKAMKRLRETVLQVEMGDSHSWESVPTRFKVAPRDESTQLWYLSEALKKSTSEDHSDSWEGWGRVVALISLDPVNDSVKDRAKATASQMTQTIISKQNKDGSFNGKDPVLATAQGILALTYVSKAIGKSPKVPQVVAGPPAVSFPVGDGDLGPLAMTRLTRALNYLDEKQVDGKFQFLGAPDPGITALALGSYIRSAKVLKAEIPDWVENGLDYLASLTKPDGSIFEQGLKVYVTSVAVLAFVESGNPKYLPIIQKAQGFLKLVQADESEGYSSEGDWAYGGIGYGGDQRPDLSNTQIALDALKSSGTDSNDEAFKKVLVFLERCQNQREGGRAITIERGGETIVPGDDGGAAYFPGDSKAGYIELENGNKIARSYGSMTYALLKSYIFAGLDREDPRVQAVLKWIRQNYTLENNPGFPSDMGPEAPYYGLYYYYFTLARALDALGMEEVEDAKGEVHLWRRELALTLFSEQLDDGSWTNHRSSRWLEGDHIVATAYAINAISHCMAEAK